MAEKNNTQNTTVENQGQEKNATNEDQGQEKNTTNENKTRRSGPIKRTVAGSLSGSNCRISGNT